MRLDVPVFALAAAAGLFGISVAAAQTPPPAAQPPFAVPPFKNLKVLPKDIARGDLLASMKFFSQSLGVRCTYCHVGTEGQPLSTFDFASDAKEHKKIARDMMRLVQHLNTDHLPAITGLPDAKVTCFTCHRGATKPATAPAPDSPNTVPPPAKPAPAPPVKNERG
jgi:photosynthetic reaction center cytochrome c subunit